MITLITFGSSRRHRPCYRPHFTKVLTPPPPGAISASSGRCRTIKWITPGAALRVPPLPPRPQTARAITDTLWPPKPNALFITVRMRPSRAWCGT